MTRKQLVQLIQDHITISGSMPYSLPEPEVVRIIERAEAFMYDNYQYSLEEKLIPIPFEIFIHPEFTKTRMIQLPDCIQFVYMLKEINGAGIIGTIDKDFSDNKLLGADIYLSPFAGDNLMYRVAFYSYFDLADQMVVETVAYKWNKNTHRLSILGRTPSRACYIKAGVRIPQESLYDDELFMRYCFADAKIKLGRILQNFSNVQLPGAIGLSFDTTKQDGLQEMIDIKAEIDSQNSPDWFLQW